MPLPSHLKMVRGSQLHAVQRSREPVKLTFLNTGVTFYLGQSSANPLATPMHELRTHLEVPVATHSFKPAAPKRIIKSTTSPKAKKAPKTPKTPRSPVKAGMKLLKPAGGLVAKTSSPRKLTNSNSGRKVSFKAAPATPMKKSMTAAANGAMADTLSNMLASLKF